VPGATEPVPHKALRAPNIGSFKSDLKPNPARPLSPRVIRREITGLAAKMAWSHPICGPEGGWTLIGAHGSRPPTRPHGVLATGFGSEPGLSLRSRELLATMTDLIEVLNTGLAGRYRVQAELGRGGMATVYRAEDLKHDRSVAVKVLLPELASVVGPERFLREIQIAANLRHPHILPLLDSGEVGGLPFYVMPFVEGESLRDKLNREKQLPIEEVVQIGREVADALAYAHERGVVHRDIKPANIMLDSGHAVVADFGIALGTHHFTSDRLTASGVSPGSPQYMSPEQAAGEDDVDGRSDIYSLGCVLYEALSGDPPFMGRLPQAILAKKLRESPPSLSVVRDSVPESLEYVVSRALGRSPADRFKNALELREALQTVAEGRSITTGLGLAASDTPPKGLPISRWAGVAAAATLVGLALLTTIGFLTTRVYDEKLGVPAAFTPTRSDFPIVGLQALLPELFWGFLAILGFVALSYAWRVVSYGLHRAPGLGDTLDTWRHTSSQAWWRVWTPLSPVAVADAFFLTAVLAGVVVLSPFWEFLSVMWTSDTEVLSSAISRQHESYTLTLTVLIVVLLVIWRSVFRYLRERGPIGWRVAVSRWGSLALIIFLLIIATLPWRLRYDNNHERALLDGEPAYILLETESDLVIYQTGRQSAARYPKDENIDLERLGVIGYLFEDVEDFENDGS